MSAKKKDIRKITDCFDASIVSEADNKFNLTVKGKNSKGTEARINVIMEDYFLEHLVTHIVKLIKRRKERLSTRIAEIKQDLNSL